MVLVTGIDTDESAFPLMVGSTSTVKGVEIVTPLTSREAELTLAVVSRVMTPFLRSVEVKAMVFSPVRVTPFTFQVAYPELGNRAKMDPPKLPWLLSMTGLTVILMRTLLLLSAGGVVFPPPLLPQEIVHRDNKATNTMRKKFFIIKVFRRKFGPIGLHRQYRKSMDFFY